VVRVLPPPTEVKKRQVVELDDTKAQQVGHAAFFEGSMGLCFALKVRCPACVQQRMRQL
jgi:hypothetical protein